MDVVSSVYDMALDDKLFASSRIVTFSIRFFLSDSKKIAFM